MYSVKCEVKVLFKISVDFQLIQLHLLEREFFLHCIAMRNQATIDIGFSLWFLCCILFVSLFWHQYHSCNYFIMSLDIWKYKYSHFVFILWKLFENQHISFHHSFYWDCLYINCNLLSLHNILQFWVFQSMNMT